MTISALLDLGGDRELLDKSLASLKLDGYTLEFGRRNKCGIDAYKFDVLLENEPSNHHDHNHHHSHEHDHDHHSHDNHSHEHNHDDHSHNHQHRGLKEISKIINESDITDGAKKLALKIFDYIAEAEAKAHNIPRDEVHFHEVGAIDSIVDVVGAAVLIDDLGVKDIVVSEIYEGSGHVKCAHGILPVPVPAVANIFMEAGLNFRITDSKGEMVTPTGAAIAASIKSLDEIPDGYIIEKIGIGSGKKDFPHANILRAFLLKKN